MKFKTWQALAAIFAVILAVRLYFVFQTPHFNGDDAYFTLRQVESIRETGFPIFYDSLSYGGRLYIFTPVFHYILAFFSIFMGTGLACKLLPPILSSLLTIVVFFITFEITKDKNASLFSAFISGFIPVFFSSIPNNISVYSLTLPLTFYMLLCFMRINNIKYVYTFLFLIFMLALIHPSVLLFVLCLVVYLLLLRLEGIKQNRAELEIILFSIFLVIWIEFIMFKKAFLFHGPSMVWQNVPFQILANYFSDISILKAVYQIGSVPLLYGIYAVYNYTFSPKQNRKIYLLLAFAFSVALLLWLKLIQLNIGLIYLGIIMSIFFGQFYKNFFLYIKKTRFHSFRPYFTLFVIFVFILTSALPSISYAYRGIDKAVDDRDVAALSWLKLNSGAKSTVLSTFDEGHLITAIAERKNVADSNFLFVDHIEQRYEDIMNIYQAPYETTAIELLNKYGVDYIYFSDNARKEFGIELLQFTADRKCFELVYNSTIQIYKSSCRID